jgi:hypothetical protein
MRYYFDTSDNGVVATDDDGVDLPGIEAVKREVARALGGIAWDVLPECERRVLAIVIRDEDGRRVLSSELVFEVGEDAGTTEPALS